MDDAPLYFCFWESRRNRFFQPCKVIRTEHENILNASLLSTARKEHFLSLIHKIFYSLRVSNTIYHIFINILYRMIAASPRVIAAVGSNLPSYRLRTRFSSVANARSVSDHFASELVSE